MFRVILHLDMDAFYASIEQRDQPELRGKPVIVGAPPNQRGVVCAASYEARRFGVRSAMPSVTAKRLCPNGIFVRPRMDHYREVSGRIMGLVADTGPLIEQVSIDEAYLDFSPLCQGEDADASLNLAVPLARALKQRILSGCQLTASIGVAANKFLAKVGSDWSKPDGLTLIPERDKVLMLRPLPVRVIHGVGQITEQALHRIGIFTVGDLQDYRGDLNGTFGRFGSTLKRFAFGEDHRPLELGEQTKSISSETTFLEDTDNRKILRQALREQAGEIAAKLERKELAAQTVQVKIRYGNFTTLTRQLTVDEPIFLDTEIFRLGCFLLARERLVSRPLRLIGLAVSGLEKAATRQLRLPLR